MSFWLVAIFILLKPEHTRRIQFDSCPWGRLAWMLAVPFYIFTVPFSLGEGHGEVD